MFLNNFGVFTTHLSQYGETEVLKMKIDLHSSKSNPIQILRETFEPSLEEELTRSNRQVVARGDRTFSEPLGVTSGTCKEEGRKDETKWELNKQMGKDSYLLTNIQEILLSLQGVTVFSSLDKCGAYQGVLNLAAEHVQQLLAHLARSNTYGCLLG